MTTPPLTRYIGQAECAMGALLDILRFSMQLIAPLRRWLHPFPLLASKVTLRAEERGEMLLVSRPFPTLHDGRSLFTEVLRNCGSL